MQKVLFALLLLYLHPFARVHFARKSFTKHTHSSYIFFSRLYFVSLTLSMIFTFDIQSACSSGKEEGKADLPLYN